MAAGGFLNVSSLPPKAETALRAVAGASVSTPRAQDSWRGLSWLRRYRELHETYDLLASSFFGLHAVDLRVAFEGRWADPVWGALDLDVPAERAGRPF